ncbi:Uncharacterised protein at_DN1736 [Pycnogonum litorale]
MSVSLALYYKLSIRPEKCEILFIIIKSVGQNLTVLTLMLSFSYVSYVDASIIANGFLIIFFIIVNRIWLKEKISCYHFVIMILILIGVLITSQPPAIFGAYSQNYKVDQKIKILGISLALLSGLFHTLSACASQRITETNAIIVILYLSVSGIVMGIVGLMIYPIVTVPNSKLEIILSLFLGLFCFGEHLTWTKGLQIASATKLVVALQLEVPSGILFDFIISRTVPNILSIIGCLTVISCIILLALQNVIVSYFQNRVCVNTS